MTDKVTEANLAGRPSPFATLVADYLATCTIPLTTPYHTLFLPPVSWTPVKAKIELPVHETGNPSDIKFGKFNNQQIDHIGYSADYNRMILFFKDGTQLVLSVRSESQVIHRDSQPTPPKIVPEEPTGPVACHNA
jgi:hypothetical protein